MEGYLQQARQREYWDGLWRWRGAISLVDVTQHDKIEQILGDHAQVETIAFSPDSTILASGGLEVYNEGGLTKWRPVIKFWHIKNRKQVNFKYETDGEILSLAFSPFNNRQLAIGSENGVFVVDLPDNSRKIADQSCGSLAFSPDGRLLATGIGIHGESRKIPRPKDLITIWDVKKGHKINEFETPSYINSVAFSPDGKALAAGCNDGSVLLWKVEP